MARNVYSAIILFILDFVIAYGSVFLGKYVQTFLPGLSLPDAFLLYKAMIFASILVGCYYFQDLYAWRYMKRSAEVFSSILLSGGIILILLAAVYYVVPSIGLDRNILLVAIISSLFLSYLFRVAYLGLRSSDIARIKAVILGDGENARFLISELVSVLHPVEFEGYIGEENPKISVRYLGDVSGISGIIDDIRPDVLVVALDRWRGKMPIHDLLDIKLSKCDVTDGPSFYEDVTGKILVEGIRPSSMIFTHGFLRTNMQVMLKRVFDIFFASLGTICAFPVMFAAAIAIRMDSPGPVFYFQDRVGRDGKDFHVIKFRSMVEDAEKNGPQWASEGDPRITRIGRFIRKTRIDELPQFINVLKNDMSFVGPRPERRYFVDQLKEHIPYYALRLHIKPGITGWAQVNYPYGDTIEDSRQKLKYDLYYAKNRSLWLDIVIIFQTLKVALKGRGAQ
ncbi:MAG: sugar transferase [Thermodesulfobacteriota bacterium]|nr:sugar transferase [Thermodesulfobacteriota bacterium]